MKLLHLSHDNNRLKLVSHFGPNPEAFYATASLLDNTAGFAYFKYLENNTEQLRKLIIEQGIRILVVDACTEPYNPRAIFNKINDLVLPIDKLYIITWDSTLTFDDNFLYFPGYFMSTRHQTHYGHHKSRKFLVNSLSRIDRFHRRLILLELLKQPWANEAYITYNNFEYIDEHIKADRKLTLEELAEYHKITLPIIDVTEDIRNNERVTHSVNVEAYTNSFVSIITETDERNFLTEKTAKGILSKTFFTIIAGTGIMKELRDMGFDIFDDIIDHEYYDSTPNIRERISRMFEVLGPIITREYLEETSKICNSRFRSNTQYFQSDEFLNKIMDPIRDKIRDYLITKG